MATDTQDFTFVDSDGYKIFVYQWDAVGPTKAVVQIAHGAVEHAPRYERLARFLNAHGYSVYANDHRGHGMTAGTFDAAGHAGEDGWNGIVRGAAQLTGIIEKYHPGIPVFLLGHSMGSLVAQQYIEDYGDRLAGVILSGSWGTMGDTTQVVGMVEQAIAADGPDAPSALFAGMFATFNERFDGITGFEWLSRDSGEVQKYVDDPWCGSFAFSNQFVLEFFKGMETIWLPENEQKIPKSLPVAVMSGALDPAGGYSETAMVLVDRYRDLGLTDLSVAFYPEARHEILNETNRDQVQQDILEWLDGRVSVPG